MKITPMTEEEFFGLHVGDVVYDKLCRRDMQVVAVTQPSSHDEGSVQFRWTETRTIYAHGIGDLCKVTA